jgi:HSP20 family protein
MSSRYDPFEEMHRMLDQMRRSTWGRTPTVGAGRKALPAFEWSDDWFSSDTTLDVERTDDGYVVMGDLPGFESEELSIRFADGTLTVDAETEIRTESGPVSTRRIRSLHEELQFPDTVDDDGITATYRNGVLEITLPAEEPGDDEDSHRIDIE